MIRPIILIILSLPLLALTLHTIIRIIRYFYKFPMPQFMADAIDNPLRRKIQPPDEMAIRHGVEPGMLVLEIGPGNGRYTVATAKRLGSQGRLLTIDIEPRMIKRVNERISAEGVTNVTGLVADVYQLPFKESWFDVIYLITVIGEIPDPDRAMREFHRLLTDSGSLAFSELILDPDYPLAGTLIRKAANAGYRLGEKIGKLGHYTLKFIKAVPLHLLIPLLISACRQPRPTEILTPVQIDTVVPDEQAVPYPVASPPSPTALPPYPVDIPTIAPEIKATPGLIVHGFVRLVDGTPLSDIIICRSFSAYPGQPVAITDNNGYFHSDFTYIPGDEMVSLWPFAEGYAFEPACYGWRHYGGFSRALYEFMARPTSNQNAQRPDCRE